MQITYKVDDFFFTVSFAFAVPDMLSQLKLPFKNEYELAKNIHKQKEDLTFQ